MSESDEFTPSDEAKARPSQWATERMDWADRRARAPVLRPTSWLRAARRVRYTVHEFSMIIVNVAGAVLACTMCYIMWVLVYAVIGHR